MKRSARLLVTKPDKNRVGYESTSYKKRVDSSWVPCGKDDPDPTKCVDSIIERYIREGRSLCGDTQAKRIRLESSNELGRYAMQKQARRIERRRTK